MSLQLRVRPEAPPRPATGTRLPRILFSTPCGPLDTLDYDTSLTDVWNQRFSRGCGPFTVTGHIHTHFAHVLAQNVAAECVFLENPTEANFLAELRRGYDYVGISAFQHQVERVIHMGRLVRRHAPAAQVLLGGWAAMGIQAVYPPAVWREWADHLCVGDGVRFLRGLLGQPVDAPLSVTHLPKSAYTFPWLDPHLPGNMGAIVASIGCVRGCDFCGPTALLERRRLQLLEPRQVVAELDRLWRDDPDLLTCNVYEEDSFTERDYLLEVGRGIREDTEAGLARINMMVLGSVRALDRWDFDEVARCGVSAVFIGVESKFAPREGYEKSRGRAAAEVFRELHRRGISTIGGWIAGFDFQTRENIEEDLQHFISLEPTMQQLTRLCAFPGTPLWERLLAEGRVDPARLDWSTVSFFGGGGIPPRHLEQHEAAQLIDRGYRQLYETWGACFARQLGVNLSGYEYCREHPDPYLRHDRARLHRRLAARALPFIEPMAVHAPNGEVRRRMRRLQARYQRLIGPPTLAQRALGQLYLRGVERELRRVRPRPAKVEPCKRYDYTAPRPPGACPYTVSHPNLDPAYAAHRQLRRLVTRGLVRAGGALDAVEGLLGRELDPELRECVPAWGRA